MTGVRMLVNGDEFCGPGRGGLYFPKHVESVIAVEDGNGLRDGSLFVCSQHFASLVLLGLTTTHLTKLLQKGLVVGLCRDGQIQRGLLFGEGAIIAGERRLFLVVGRFHGGVLLQLGRHQGCVSFGRFLLRAPGRFEIRLESGLHLLEDPENGTGLRCVGSSEGSLEQGFSLRSQCLAQEGVRGKESLLHSRPQPQQRAAVVTGQKLLVIGSCLQCLIGTDGSQNFDGLLELSDRRREISLLCLECLALFGPQGLHLISHFHVGVHVFRKLSTLRTQQSIRTLQLLDAVLQQADLLCQLSYRLCFHGCVIIAVALVLRVQFPLLFILCFGGVQQLLEQLHNLGDGAIPTDRGFAQGRLSRCSNSSNPSHSCGRQDEDHQGRREPGLH
mmetsp:Transcript_2404/g.5571  ORF Transcript_2404/g.5571 Transcript_2404/m.5571 type:complete len:387 (-) Transcript_2404:68-1228(-)